MPRSAIENNVITIKSKKYFYYMAAVTILRKRYTKTFPHTPEGLASAYAWIKETLSCH